MTISESANYQREQAAREHAEKMRNAYCRMFASDHGKLVLADLLAKYGFTEDGIENPSYLPGRDAAEVAHKEGMKEPIRHILAAIRSRLSTLE
ncbi:hypothetical protein OpiT1DRAFT_05425 [Opitutaceae bacterium TAV1]|nr:hypothetical protein OpiT1DRAFT_05425 [Opitutaceae bacterium TAV1]